MSMEHSLFWSVGVFTPLNRGFATSRLERFGEKSERRSWASRAGGGQSTLLHRGSWLKQPGGVGVAKRGRGGGGPPPENNAPLGGGEDREPNKEKLFETNRSGLFWWCVCGGILDVPIKSPPPPPPGDRGWGGGGGGTGAGGENAGSHSKILYGRPKDHQH